MSAEKCLIKSNSDDVFFRVNEKVVNSSVLLKNIIEFTAVTSDLIGIDCSATSLKTYIEFFQIREENENEDEKRIELEVELFKRNFTDDTGLANFIKDVCILDCDILLDSLADFILDKIKGMTVEEINEYLEIKNDFTFAEKEWQNQNMFEYFISLNDSSFPLQFPIPCQNFYSIKTKFSSPLNILLARICQRSNPYTSLKLSFCCKALKNECDRQPIKVTKMSVSLFSLYLIIEELETKWFFFVKKENEKYFFAVSKRKVMAWNDNISIGYSAATFSEVRFNVLKEYLSLQWMIPHKKIKKVTIMFGNFQTFISNFDIVKCPFSNIRFDLIFNDGIDFDFVYNNLVAKDLSKELELHCYRFDFSSNATICNVLSKKPNASKFFYCLFDLPNKKPQPKFKAFLEDFMEIDGRFEFPFYHPIIPEHIVYSCVKPSKIPTKYCCISDLIKYL